MLSQVQIDQFETTGVLVVDDVLPADVLNNVKAEYTDLLDRLYDDWHAQGIVPPADGQDFLQKLLSAHAAGCDWFQPLDISLPGDEIMPGSPFHFGPAVFDMLICPRLLDAVECLIGPELTSNPIQHVRLKPPVNVVPDDELRAQIVKTEWHQDCAVALEEADQTKMVTVWIAVNDATIENGCLQCVPGKPRMYPHCPKKQTTIADGFLDESAGQPLPVKAGGAVLFHPLTPHSSLDNHSDQFRWSFDIRYNVTGHPTGRSHFPEFIARSRQDPSSELKDWQKWRDMWIDARTRLSGQDHIPLHRWQADAPACA